MAERAHGLRGSIRSCTSISLMLSICALGHAAVPDPGPGRMLQLRLLTHPRSAADKPGTNAAKLATMSVRAGKRVDVAASPQRSSELSSQHIVIVGLNARQQEIWRTVQIDPRLLRAEGQPLLDGTGQRQATYRADVEFSVTPPEALPIRQISIYKPRWTGTDFELDLISTAAVNPR